MANLGKFANKVAQEAAQFVERKGGSLENKTEQMILKEAQEAGFDLEQAAARHGEVSPPKSLGTPEEIAQRASAPKVNAPNPMEAQDISELGLNPENIRGKAAAVKSPVENAKDLTKNELKAANTPEANSLLDDLNRIPAEEEVPKSLLDKIAANKGKIAAGAALAGTAGFVASNKPKPAPVVSPTPEVEPVEVKEEVLPSAAGKTSPLKAASQKVKEVSKQIETLPEDKRTYFEKQKDLLDQSLEDLKDKYAEDKEQIGLMEAIETVGKGLLQVGAGIHGVRTGVDMSGVKFNPVNWGKQYDLLKDELKMQLEEIQHAKGLVSKAELTGLEESGKNEREKAKLSSEERMAKERNATTLRAAGIKADTTKEVAGNKAATKAIGSGEKDLKQQKQAFDYVYNTLASGQYNFDLDKAKKKDKKFNTALSETGLPPDLLEQTWASKGLTDFDKSKRIKLLLDAHKRALDAKLGNK